MSSPSRATVLVSVALVSTAGLLLLLLKQSKNRSASKLRRDELMARRRKLFCPAQSVSYSNAGGLLILSGRDEFLFDENGTRYLDTRNNVAHIGHSHPSVVKAVSEQIAVLNTNTRYLHPHILDLAEQLLQTFPSTLNVCFFVNSGSEANDLALRLAAAHTKREHLIVVDRAYHGHTIGSAGVSPHKFNHPLGPQKRPNTHVVTCPDVYRGPHKGDDAAELYAKEIETICQEHANYMQGMLIESGLSVAGVVIPPVSYLSRCFAAVREIGGGVCICDEVQVGFGRLGDHFWGFEQQGVVPDIVTIGKPFGNGMPLAAVVTTQEISNSFAKGPEYFSTFGGNPVVCAAGLAVLDTLKRERLQEGARDKGRFLISLLSQLAAKHSLIGNVRGQGLFVGIEFVRDRVTLEPATAEASFICSQLMVQHQILTSLDGPHDNVMVIKPPMCISRSSIAYFVQSLDTELSRLATHPDIASAIGHTPT